jgi:hypothetical protein
VDERRRPHLRAVLPLLDDLPDVPLDVLLNAPLERALLPDVLLDAPPAAPLDVPPDVPPVPALLPHERRLDGPHLRARSSHASRLDGSPPERPGPRVRKHRGCSRQSGRD